MLSIRHSYEQAMFGSSASTGGRFMAASVPVTTTAAPLQSLKRRRRGSLEQEEHQGGGGGRGGVQQYEVDPEESASTVKRRRNSPFSHTRDTFQLALLSPPTNTQHGLHSADPFAPYKTYQPTPPIDSDSDSSTDRFSARFMQDEEGDEDMDDAGAAMSQSSELPWRRAPQVVIGPPTPVSEMGPGMGRLDVGEDVDMERREGGAGEKKRAGGFRMGFRADCEKCRMRVPGHYSHY